MIKNEQSWIEKLLIDYFSYESNNTATFKKKMNNHSLLMHFNLNYGHYILLLNSAALPPLTITPL